MGTITNLHLIGAILSVGGSGNLNNVTHYGYGATDLRIYPKQDNYNLNEFSPLLATGGIFTTGFGNFTTTDGERTFTLPIWQSIRLLTGMFICEFEILA